MHLAMADPVCTACSAESPWMEARPTSSRPAGRHRFVCSGLSHESLTMSLEWLLPLQILPCHQLVLTDTELRDHKDQKPPHDCLAVRSLSRACQSHVALRGAIMLCSQARCRTRHEIWASIWPRIWSASAQPRHSSAGAVPVAARKQLSRVSQ